MPICVPSFAFRPRAPGMTLVRRVSRACVAAAAGVAVATAPIASAAQESLPIIRDAEIEGLMRIYTKPIFKAAGLQPGAVRVHLIKSRAINAFVADGQRMFIYTGLLSSAKTPGEVMGVLAHETGHIAGGHLARLGLQMDKASNLAIIGMLLGAAAMVGGAVAGSKGGVEAGTGVMLGGPGVAQRNLLAYARAQEAAADQAAVKFLTEAGQSARGVLELFYKLANQSIASVQYVDPYVLSHPMPLERIRNLERLAKASPHFDKPDPPALVLRHELMQAKLSGFLDSPQVVYRKYPPADSTLPARYARAIAAFRGGDLKNALPLIDTLIKDIPQNPYFWELKGQALLEGGRPQEAVAPLQQAVKLLPSSGLIRLMLAQAQLGVEGSDSARAALETLKVARRTETDSANLHMLMAKAYGRLDNLPLAELETAEMAIRRDDRELAIQKATNALKGLKQGTPEWLRANDILNYTKEE
jgi:predicted Zn-dependent protease